MYAMDFDADLAYLCREKIVLGISQVIVEVKV